MEYYKLKTRPEVFTRSGEIFTHVTDPNTVPWGQEQVLDKKFVRNEQDHVYLITDRGFEYVPNPDDVDWGATIRVVGLPLIDPIGAGASNNNQTVTPLKQSDPRWAKYPLGTTTVGKKGCVVTAIGSIIGSTPDWVTATMAANGGIRKGGEVVWEVAARVFGLKWDPDRTTAKVSPVIVNTSAHGGHFFLLLANGQIMDPITGKIEANKYANTVRGYRNLSK